MSSRASQDALEHLWQAFVQEARASRPIDPPPSELIYEPTTDSQAFGAGARRGAAFPISATVCHASVESELELQAAYIAELEAMILGSPVAGAQPVSPPHSRQRSTPAPRVPTLGMVPTLGSDRSHRSMRQENRALQNKVAQLQTQLQQARARCRHSGEAACARHRHADPHRPRDLRPGKRNMTPSQLVKLDEVVAQRDILHELLRVRSQQLLASGRRCAELELSVQRFNAAFRQALPR
ncbi:hypothetical protein AB1Y20_000342 [Prymnesium parvum]|uniref:Uncharacterized protein n=1 Tax=Prymnesium parvum TaxID=97485 RepID=A0AB34K8T3_PRYPA